MQVIQYWHSIMTCTGISNSVVKPFGFVVLECVASLETHIYLFTTSCRVFLLWLSLVSRRFVKGKHMYIIIYLF